MKKTLTMKQEAFCQAFIKNRNANEAYREAYHVPSDTKSKSVSWFVKDTMENPKIIARIAELEKEQPALKATPDDKPFKDAAPCPSPFWKFIRRTFNITS